MTIKVKCEISHLGRDIIVKCSEVEESGQMVVEGESLLDLKRELDSFVDNYINDYKYYEDENGNHNIEKSYSGTVESYNNDLSLYLRHLLQVEEQVGLFIMKLHFASYDSRVS